jgi:hypothetical protein
MSVLLQGAQGTGKVLSCCQSLCDTYGIGRQTLRQSVNHYLSDAFWNVAYNMWVVWMNTAPGCLYYML